MLFANHVHALSLFYSLYTYSFPQYLLFVIPPNLPVQVDVYHSNLSNNTRQIHLESSPPSYHESRV